MTLEARRERDACVRFLREVAKDLRAVGDPDHAFLSSLANRVRHGEHVSGVPWEEPWREEP